MARPGSVGTDGRRHAVGNTTGRLRRSYGSANSKARSRGYKAARKAYSDVVPF